MVAELDTAELRELHLALAQALAELGAAPELLAEHFERGGDRVRALAYVEQAATQAAAALGFARAVELYRRALSLLPADATPEHRETLQAALAEQIGNVGHCGEAAEMFLQLVEQSRDRAQIVAYRHQAITHLIASGQIDRGLDVLEAALASFGERLPPPATRPHRERPLDPRARVGIRGGEGGRVACRARQQLDGQDGGAAGDRVLHDRRSGLARTRTPSMAASRRQGGCD
jgi:tetratricopeptide (TPR) repeat protein